MKKIIIVGAGDLGKQICHYIQDISEMVVIGFLDDVAETDKVITGQIKNLGKIQDIEKLYHDKIFDEVVIGIGYKHLDFRRNLFDSFKNKKLPLARIVHPTVYVDKTARIEEGVVLFPNCHIDKGSTVSENSLLNIGCSVAHDSVIGPNSFLGPRVNLAGFIKTEGMNFFGIGTIIIDNIKIASGVKTGGGSVVVTDLNSSGLYVGVPAKRTKD